MSAAHERLWEFKFREGGIERTTTLTLDAELCCLPCIEDAEDQSGDGQVRHFVAYAQSELAQAWERDAIPIFWTVMGDGVFELAPFNLDDDDEHFLSIWTMPRDVLSGEKINWRRLPIRPRFPKFAAALGWQTAPFQATAPLRSIITGAQQRLQPPPPPILSPLARWIPEPDERPN
jgi:hypothetical protein